MSVSLTKGSVAVATGDEKLLLPELDGEEKLLSQKLKLCDTFKWRVLLCVCGSSVHLCFDVH